MKNVHKKIPSVVLIIALVGFPQISESIFTPVLPALSQAMRVRDATSQLTMSSYFIGFAFGVLFWGWLSDRIGRRPAMSWGIIVYLMGNIGLYLASDFELLIVARGIQAFGAATGSVVIQTIMRESFSGVAGEKVFAKVSAAMALSPALGPLLGGALQSYFGSYRSVFALLISMAILLELFVLLKLPETKPVDVNANKTPWYRIAKQMVRSPKVIAYCLIISGINGILFSYYAEAPFVFEHHFGLSAMEYGWLGMVIATASIVGAVVTNRLAGVISPEKITDWGLLVALVGSIGMLLTTFNLWLLILAIFITFMGLNITLPIALNRALIGFETVIGTASGMLSFVYYLVISAFTFLMSLMHDRTVTALPKYTLLIVVIMVVGRLSTQKLINKSE